MTCPNCRASVAVDERACAACGWALPGIGPGCLVASRYRILEELGAGGMGVVFKARDEELDDTVALKVLRPDARLGAQASRFRSEIRLARRIRHANVCAIHEYGEEEGLLYISMELVNGRDLKRLLRENGPFHWEDGVRVALQIAAGLEAIHEAEVIHRDLKPANIMKDSKDVVRIMDFGIAKAWNPETGSDFTKTGHIVGSPEYMSPEQIRDATLDFRSDLYSFGVVLYEIFTGRLPFAAETPVEVMHKHLSEPPPLDSEAASRIPEALLPILRRALAKGPGDRYSGAAEMRRALEKARVDSPTPFVPVPTPHGVRSRPDVARLLIPQLLRALGHAAAAVRRDAALALGTTESDSALVRSALHSARSDDDPGVRAAVAEALQRLPATPRPSPAAPESPRPSTAPPSSEATAVHLPPEPPPEPQPRSPAPSSAQPSAPEPVPGEPQDVRRSRIARRIAIAAALTTLLVLSLAWLSGRTRRAAAPLGTLLDVGIPNGDASQVQGASPGPSPLPSPDETPQPRPNVPSFSVASVPSPQISAAPTPRPSPEAHRAATPSAAPPPVVTTTILAAPSAEVLIPPEAPAPEPSVPTTTEPPAPTIPRVRPGDLVDLSDPDVRPPRAPVGLSPSPTPIMERVGVKGAVDLSILVDETGRVLKIDKVTVVICRPSGAQYERILRDAALKSAAQWRFEPATKGGVPVQVWVDKRIRF